MGGGGRAVHQGMCRNTSVSIITGENAVERGPGAST